MVVFNQIEHLIAIV